ncbi:hypothetical protein 043JT007_243 [Bacillus phage 043JT007]|nr:hypothetical protein 043JT007_243 [Bacillus phage 043JT007]
MTKRFFVEDAIAVWVPGNTPAYMIPKSFEWVPKDESSYFDEIPVVLVSKAAMDSVEYALAVLPDDLMEAIAGDAVVSEDDIDEGFDPSFAAILTDKNRSIIVVAEDEGFIEKKSRLDPATDYEVASKVAMYDDLKEFDWDINVEKKEAKEKTALEKFETPPEEVFIGITRRERKMKELLMNAVFDMGCKGNVEEIKYWISEMAPSSNTSDELKNMDVDSLLQYLYDAIKQGWTEEHEVLGEGLVKGYGGDYAQWKSLRKANKDMIVRFVY